MTATDDTASLSPWTSIWLNPRQTIERIVADRPRYLVLPLITLGGAASTANMLAGYGAGSEIVGWRTLLACVVGGALFAIFNLYVLAVVTGWIGRKLGGVASNDAVRAVPSSPGGCCRISSDLRSFCRLPPAGASCRLSRSRSCCRPCSIL